MTAEETLRDISARFVHAHGDDPHYDRFWAWLRHDRPHEDYHRFIDASRALSGGDAVRAAERFVEIMAEEWDLWKRAHRS